MSYENLKRQARHLRRLALAKVVEATKLPRRDTDPALDCDVFEPGEPSEFGPCWTDGHYMCAECRHANANAEGVDRDEDGEGEA